MSEAVDAGRPVPDEQPDLPKEADTASLGDETVTAVDSAECTPAFDRSAVLSDGRLLDDQARTLFALHTPFFLALCVVGASQLTNWSWHAEQFGRFTWLICVMTFMTLALQTTVFVRLLFRYPFDSYSLKEKYLHDGPIVAEEHLLKRMREQIAAVSFAAGLAFSLMAIFVGFGSVLAILGRFS
ncbi:hypothetical protein D2T29_06650 [Sinirhodobacter populi]|uniref:Uncharacterized protein n=1 Tax=Paenirhodobacter populi TaxID=2306993 RepID=A0A443KKM6_9RHOB|nr:hypothetical protein [Sinirhodobacter populi]RWR33332.1 hypothetical protein D2T29_06650 [Sinirhodobacter populi]